MYTVKVSDIKEQIIFKGKFSELKKYLKELEEKYKNKRQ